MFSTADAQAPRCPTIRNCSGSMSRTGGGAGRTAVRTHTSLLRIPGPRSSGAQSGKRCHGRGAATGLEGRPCVWVRAASARRGWCNASALTDEARRTDPGARPALQPCRSLVFPTIEASGSLLQLICTKHGVASTTAAGHSTRALLLFYHTPPAGVCLAPVAGSTAPSRPCLAPLSSGRCRAHAARVPDWLAIVDGAVTGVPDVEDGAGEVAGGTGRAGILNDDQGGPLHPPGLRMSEALQEVRESLARNLDA